MDYLQADRLRYKTVGIRLSKPQKDLLVNYAKREEMTISEVARAALNAYFANKDIATLVKHEVPKNQLSMFNE